MRAKYAREIRRGIRIAQQVIRRERRGPQLTPFGTVRAPAMPLWEQAYHHTMSHAVQSGRLRPPTQLNPSIVIRDTIEIPN